MCQAQMTHPKQEAEEKNNVTAKLQVYVELLEFPSLDPTAPSERCVSMNQE